MEETELLVKISNMLLDYARENNVEFSKQQMSKLLKSVCNVLTSIKQSKTLAALTMLQ